jgi:hypothetical protein
MVSRTLGITIAGTVAIALAGVWALIIMLRRRRKSPEEIERLRRASVNACGRIISGSILGLAESGAEGPAGPILLYAYEVAGVTYEAAQDVSALPRIASAARFLPGQATGVKYDPKQPSNSILACEAWCGVPDLEARPNDSSAPREESGG